MHFREPTKQLEGRDGFSAGGTDLIFENNYVVNGDDCLTVGSGAKNIIFRLVSLVNIWLVTHIICYPKPTGTPIVRHNNLWCILRLTIQKVKVVTGCLLGRLEKEVQSLTSRIYCKSRLIILDIVILLSNSSMDHRIDNNLMVSRIFYSFSPLYPDIYKEKHALRGKIQKLDWRQWIS